MRKIRNFLAAGAVVCSLCALSGCAVDPGSYQFSRDELAEVVSVELIEYENPAQKHFLPWVPDHSSDLKPFDSEKVRVLETLDADMVPQFGETLCECDILYLYYAYDSPNGICMRLSYSDGDFLILNCAERSYAGYIGRFSPDGEVARFIGCFSSRGSFEFLMDFFETEL